LLCAAGCNRPQWGTPAGAYASFVALLNKGEIRAAFAGLSAETRKRLSERAKEVSQASGDSVRAEPMLYLFMPDVRSAGVTEVKVVEETADAAVLRVVAGGRPSQVQMVKEGENWRVDLSKELQADSTGPQAPE
jgi:hypothetical protein